MRGFLTAGLGVLFGLPLGAEPVSFSKEVAPILQQQCVGCHKEGKAKGRYRLDTFEQLRKDLEPGDLESEFFYRLITDDEEERMPAKADALPEAGWWRVCRQGR